MADYNAILKVVEEKAAAARQHALDLQKLFYAMGQNQLKIAQEQAAVPIVFNGRHETVESAKQRLQSELEAQQKIRALAQSIDYDALSYSILQDTEATVQKARQVADKIAQDSSVSLWEDPGLALANAFTLPWDQQELAGLEQKLAVLNAASEKVNTQISKYAETTSKLKESLTQASLETLTAGIAAEQNIKAIKTHNEALALEAQGIKAISEMNSAELSALQAGYNIMATEEHRRAMAEERRLARLERIEARKERQAAAAERDKEKQRLQNLIAEDVEFVKAALRETSPDGTVRFTDEQILNGLMRKTPFIMQLADRGHMIALQGRAAFGENPFEIANFLQTTGVPATTEGQRSLAAAVGKAVTVGNAAPGDKQAKAQAAKAALETQFKAWQSDVGNGDKTNPLGLPSFESLAATKAVVSNPAFSLIQDVVTDPKQKDSQIDMQLVYGRLVNGIADRKVRIEDATRLIHDIGVSSVQYNQRINKVHQFTGLDQTVATVYVKPGNFAGRLALDLGPAVSAGGLATGVGAIPALVGGTAVSAFGYAAMQSRVPMNIIDPADVKYKLSVGVAAKLGPLPQLLPGDKK